MPKFVMKLNKVYNLSPSLMQTGGQTRMVSVQFNVLITDRTAAEKKNLNKSLKFPDNRQ